MIDTKPRPLFWLALLAGGVVTPVVAQEIPRRVSYGLEVAFRSGHADRGFLISDRAVVQPVTWIGWSGAELSLWGSVPLTPNTDGSRPNIAEFELTRTHRWGKLKLAPSLRLYYYHDALSRDRDHSLEGWLKLSLDLGLCRLFTTPSIDVLTYPGAFFMDSGVESEGHVASWLVLGGSLRAGWASSRFNDEYAGVPKSTLDRVSAESWLAAYVMPKLYIAPHLEYNATVDSDLRAQLNQPNYLLVRVAVGGEF